MQVEYDPYQLQLNQLLDDCERACAIAESYDEQLDIISMYERMKTELDNQNL
jgi:hypothetical protein